MEKGTLGTAVEPAHLATVLIAMADGLQVQWLLDREAVDMRAELRRFLQVAVPASLEMRWRGILGGEGSGPWPSSPWIAGLQFPAGGHLGGRPLAELQIR